jgi:hypothetical protein
MGQNMMPFAVCRVCSQSHVATNPGTLWLVKRAFNPIFSVHIWMIRELTALRAPTWMVARLRAVTSRTARRTLAARGGSDAKNLIHLLSQLSVIILRISLFYLLGLRELWEKGTGRWPSQP